MVRCEGGTEAALTSPGYRDRRRIEGLACLAGLRRAKTPAREPGSRNGDRCGAVVKPGPVVNGAGLPCRSGG